MLIADLLCFDTANNFQHWNTFESGTVDITVQRKEVDGSLSSLHAATGGPWGGQMVNKEFINFLTDIVGNEVMEIFLDERNWRLLRPLAGFETKKRIISHEKDISFFIRIP
ncbi:hypothetical protein KUTeg_024069 [Tegillarca granosa]|uniref:Uncharacterized protein n=1 Tax=Tegillarca granosa TaxID=220873 RepID=A0ABQ9E2M8_TEGGR|nr:hypothetical protein KUTeg_024069 [Tegillarca granosa]